MATKEHMYTCTCAHIPSWTEKHECQNIFRIPQCIGINWNHTVDEITWENKDKKGLKIACKEQKDEVTKMTEEWSEWRGKPKSVTEAKEK